MDIKQFLFESDDVLQFIIDIQYKCSKFYQDTTVIDGAYPVYRSVSETIPKYKIYKSRKNRTPRDTPQVLHDLFDKEFKKKFGWKVRSEGVFCSGASKLGYYGNPYLFAPIGNYKFVWSPKIEDLFLYIDTHPVLTDIVNGRINFNVDTADKVYLNKIKDSVKQIVNTYIDTDIIGAIEMKNEIVVKCDSYYLINPDYIGNYYKRIYK